MFKTIRQTRKLLRIIIIFQLDQLILPKKRCISYYLSHLYWRQQQQYRTLTAAERLKQALITMGPIMIKFGQMLSTRVDMIPKDICRELTALQDNVEPIEINTIKHILAQPEYHNILAHIAQIQALPLGSASIAQVHSGVLKNGNDIALKIVKPGVLQQIQAGVKILTTMAGWIDYLHPQADKIQAQKVVDTFASTLYAECDMCIEAGNYSYMRHKFSSNINIHIPKVYWQFTNKNVLVLERIDGISYNEVITNNHCNAQQRRHLSDSAMRLFFIQVFEHNFFHADLHPGNIFISTSTPPVLQFVDFGIVGSLTKQDQIYLAKNMHAFMQQNYDEVVRLHIQSGWINANINQLHMSASLRTLGESIQSQPLANINMTKVLSQIIHIARNYGMIVQPQLLLLQKSLVQVEFISRQLDPSLNPWEIAQPVIQKWLEQQYSLSHNSWELIKKIPEFIHNLQQEPILSGDNIATRQPPMPSRHAQSRQSNSLFFIATVITCMLAINISLLIYQ